MRICNDGASYYSTAQTHSILRRWKVRMILFSMLVKWIIPQLTNPNSKFSDLNKKKILTSLFQIILLLFLFILTIIFIH